MDFLINEFQELLKLNEYLLKGDRWLFHKINQEWTNPTLDWLMPIVSDFHHVGLRYLVPLLVLWLLFKWRGVYQNWRPLTRVLIGAVLSFALTDSISYRVIKPWVHRDRPDKAGIEFTLRVENHSGQSFPSNHAANTFAVANAICFVYPGLWLWLFGYAFMVAYSRVYVGVHFPVDVFAGAILGLILSWLVMNATMAWSWGYANWQAWRVRRTLTKNEVEPPLFQSSLNSRQPQNEIDKSKSTTGERTPL